MNPMTWPREHQVALLLGIALGILLGLLIGYTYNAFHPTTLQNWTGGAASDGEPSAGWSARA